MKTKAHRVKRERSLLKSRVFWYALLLSLFVFSLIYLMFLSPVFQVREIRVTGNEKIGDEEIGERAVFNNILLFETKNIFFVNAAKTQANILSAFPVIESVRLKRNFPSRISLFVQEKERVAVWCGDICFVLDKDGVAFESMQDPGFLTIYTAQKEGSIGEKLIDKKTLSFVSQFQNRAVEFLARNGAEVQIPSFRIVSAQTVHATTSEGWNVYLNIQKDMDWQLTKLGVVFERELSPDKRARLEYVDVRFGDQAYIKYRE